MNTLRIVILSIFAVCLLSASHALKPEKQIAPDISAATHSAEENRIASEKAMAVILTVLKHPRCMNCHPSDDVPRQSEDRHKHRFSVQRGKDGNGTATMRCNTCHQTENNRISGVPGAPHWHLAPKSMGWQGLSDAEIAQALVDKSKNGNRSVDDIVKHLTEDPLVRWAWEPGKGRTPPPVPFDEFAKTVREWAATGAVVPGK